MHQALPVHLTHTVKYYNIMSSITCCELRSWYQIYSFGVNADRLNLQTCFQAANDADREYGQAEMDGRDSSREYILYQLE